VKYLGSLIFTDPQFGIRPSEVLKVTEPVTTAPFPINPPS